MASDKMATDWLLTIPMATHTADDVSRLYALLGAAGIYQGEEGQDTGYQHWQSFIQLPTRKRFSTLKRDLTNLGFDDCHIEPRYSSVAACVAYCSKSDTAIVPPTTIGTIDMRDKQGTRQDLADMRSLIVDDGYTARDVILADTDNKSARYTRWLHELEDAKNAKKYSILERDIEVYYLYGSPGVGKTRHVYDRYGAADIYRVTDYKHPFDAYAYQPVLLLDEFNAQFSWEQLLVLLDRYPTELPARYANKWAAYTTVWLVSNRPLCDQYAGRIGIDRKAIYRRIKAYYRMDMAGVMTELDPLTDQPKVTLSPQEQQTISHIADLFGVTHVKHYPSVADIQ